LEQYFSSRQIEESISIVFALRRSMIDGDGDGRWPTTMAVPMPMPIGQQLHTYYTTNFPCTYLFPDCQPHPKSV
jgi:hypothetical protein